MDLQSLRAALKPLTQFGSDEHVFDVEGITVALRPLLPREEIASQQFASAVLAQTQEEEGLDDDDPLTRTAALRYMDQFRIEIISYAIVQIGDTDLRGLTHIETGELLDNGTPVKIPTHVAMRNIMTESWSRGMITIAFSKYGDLVTKIAQKADKIAEASIADLDAEIDRQEKRLTSLRLEREKRAAGDPGVTYEQIRGLVSAGEALSREVDQAIDIVQHDTAAAAALRQAAEAEVAEIQRKMADAEAADAAALAADLAAEEEAEEDVVMPSDVHEAAARAAQAALNPSPAPRQSVIPKAAPPPAPRLPPSPEGFVSSFADPDEDPNAMLPDQARLNLARRQAALDGRKGLGDPLSQATQVGVVRGAKGEEIPAYKLPSETISGRGRQQTEAPQAAPDIDPSPKGGGSLNPNFKPPGGR